MKIIIQTSAVKYPLTGIGRYTYELAENLRHQLGKQNVEYFNGARFVDNLLETEASFIKKDLGFLKKLIIKTKILARLYHLFFPLIQGFNLINKRNYIYHGPNYYLPKFCGKSVVTIHDLSVFSWSWCHPEERVRAIQKAINYSVEHASIILTDSEYVRQEIASLYNIPIEKIVAVPLAAGSEFKIRNRVETEHSIKKYDLEYQNYTLFVSTIEPRKNIASLLEAYKSIPLNIRSQFPLIIIGFKGWKSEDIHGKMLEAETEGWLRYIGYADAQDLPDIYSSAKLFVFPSYYEGFGLPVLEAMASGIPVVCSNSSSIPEVVGDAAAMCDPNDVKALSNLIYKGLVDNDWREQAIAKGLQQAKKFSWKRCAEETAKVYKSL